MEEKKVNKRKIDKIEETDNSDEMIKKQKTEQQEQNNTIIFSKMTPENDKGFLEKELLIDKIRTPWLIRESQTSELLTFSVLKKTKGNSERKHVSLRYVHIEGTWEVCPIEKDELAEKIKKRTPLDCDKPEIHIANFCQRIKSQGLRIDHLVKPTAEQQSQVQAYRGYTATFFASVFEPQEKKPPEIDMKIFDEEISGSIVLKRSQ